ncbi:phosphoribosyltransferase [Candidatus Dependentiae bacterium]|nr:MAG: phosphoribosyltransferase [Candidatus Dependentiae bacterium]
MTFVDRQDAGKQLADKLAAYRNHHIAIVIGLPRGGVIPAAEIAKELKLPLDIVVPRKIGAPFNSELAVGAVTQDGQVVWNEKLMKSFHLSPDDLDLKETIKKERAESNRRLSLYRRGRPPLVLKDKTVIIVDDGIATGATMRAAIAYAKQQGAAKIIAATPVATVDTLELIAPEVDEIVSVKLPKTFLGISAFYDIFGQTSDDEVIEVLA